MSDQPSDLPDEIDWSDLQDFFLDHLRGTLDEMEALLQHADGPALTRIGHGLKGSGGGVQLPRFTELGRELEGASLEGNWERIAAACRAIRDEYLVHRTQEAQELRRLFLPPAPVQGVGSASAGKAGKESPGAR